MRIPLRVFFFVVITSLLLTTVGLAQQSSEPKSPTSDEILSAMQNSETAIALYEQDIGTIELTTGEKLSKDREVVERVREVIRLVRQDPEKKFTSGAALLLVSGLDDASRNEGLNGMQLLLRIASSPTPSKQISDLHLVSAIQRTDQLLYVASDEVFKLGLQRAEFDQASLDLAVQDIDACMAILKKHGITKP